MSLSQWRYCLSSLKFLHLEVGRQDKRSAAAEAVLKEGLMNELSGIGWFPPVSSLTFPGIMVKNFEESDNKSIVREYISMLHMAAIYQCTLQKYKDVSDGLG
jgi:hypothetical protein